jgi:hypothetical protein
MIDPDTPHPFPIPNGKGWLVANCLGAAAFLYLLHRLWRVQAAEGYTFGDGWELVVLLGIFAVGNSISLLSALGRSMVYRSWVPMRIPLIGLLIWGAILFYFELRR